MKRLWVWLLLTGVLAAQPEPRYPKETAAQWLGLLTVRTTFAENSGLEAVTPLTIIKKRKVPFEAVGIAPSRSSGRPKVTWTVPPFATIGPPGTEEAAPAAPEIQAPVFAEVDITGDAPSPYLRPKAGPSKVQARFRDFEIPPALSRACYASNDAGLFEFSIYGGTSSFAAEDAFEALAAALENKTELRGYGERSMLGEYKEQIEKKYLEEKRFESIEVVGKPQPEAIDPGLNAAKKAPAFKDISTKPLSSGHLDLSKLPKRKQAPPRAPRDYWVLLAYYPEKALALEFSLDKRLGTPQNLVDLANQVHNRLKQ
ncbi:MAG: hypothetical protein KF760_33115 [Candidatus Eremiobacteraeota bacterium]|nr:hypothetical protein [Candidatus Eremiobacteraeota bacterium]MCW5870183.1 hypothetical protein [Candidatus Eremiobacteraeota bacterium]